MTTDQTEQLRIRMATVADAQTVAEHRVTMFEDIGTLSAEKAPPVRDALDAVLPEMLATGEYVGWFVVTPEDVIVAGAGVQVRRLLPGPGTLIPREALVVNVYVAPEYRKQGLARRLMTAVLAWCREQGIERVSLHASHMGRHLYETLGFAPSNEMLLYQGMPPLSHHDGT